MLEALVAFAIVAVILGVALPAVWSAATRQADRMDRLHAAEFALSVFQEYTETYPAMPMTGSDPSGWTWRITERVVQPDGPTSLDPVMDLVELSLKVSTLSNPDRQLPFTSLMARRK